MASSSATSWKGSLSALDRYDMVRNIQSSLSAAASEAIAIEQAAYQAATTRAEYEAACLSPAVQTHADAAASNSPGSGDARHLNAGVRIGPYGNCTLVAEGVTSQVYRCGDRALKVIVVHGSLAPHNPQREAKILSLLHPPCIPLLDVFRDQEQRLVLSFEFMPLTLADLLTQGPLSKQQVRAIFTDLLRALEAIHDRGIIHRDVKPSAVLLQSPDGPAFLSDFGTAWHPELSAHDEPATDKILDIGTGPYRAPELLFADRTYGPPIDMWGVGVMLSEAIRSPPLPLFESRPVHEDGNQLGLILSIFKTLGTPTPETWPEARAFRVSPFELWTVFPRRPWEEILPHVDSSFRDLIAALVRYDGKRASATTVRTPAVNKQHMALKAGLHRPQALKFQCLAGESTD